MSPERELPKGWAMTTLGEVVEATTVQRKPKEEESFLYIDIASIDRNLKKVTATQKLTGKEAPSRARKEVFLGDVIVSMTRPNLNAVARIDESLNGQIASTGFDVLRPVEVSSGWIFYFVRSNEFIATVSTMVQGALYPAIRSDELRSIPIPLPPLAEQVRIVSKLEATLSRVEAARERLQRVPALLARLHQSVLQSAMSGELTRDWRGGGDAEWEETTLGEAAKVVGGGTPKASDPENFQEEGGIPWVTPADLSGYNGMYIARGKRNLSQKGYDGSSAKLMPKETVLFSSRAPIGYVAIAQNEISTNQGFKSLIPSEKLDSKFLFFHLKSIKDVAEQRATGTTFKELSGKATALLPISLPPLPEQLEIVRRVEAMFAHIDALEAQHRAALQLCERLTPALLQKAFRGELVPQDENDEPASLLLERIRAERAAAAPKKRASKPKKPKA